MYAQLESNNFRIGKSWKYRLAREMRIRNFSKNTVCSQLYYNKELLRFANNILPLAIKGEDIKDYLDFLLFKNRPCSTFDVAINAIKFYYGNILIKNIVEILYFSGLRIDLEKYQ